MAYRYSNTDKWSDCWFSKLKPIEKLLFNYLCDNCDIAGFIELNQKRWASDIGTESRIIEGALKGLGRGLIYSDTNDCIYIKNFLKHQKNLPLNEKNKAHLGILKRFELYSFKFSITEINEFIEGASKGLPSPSGNGIGNGIGNGNEDLRGKKQKSEFIKPLLSDVISYFKENGYSEESGKKAYNYYTVMNWIDSKGHPVKNWKGKMLSVWFKPENLDRSEPEMVAPELPESKKEFLRSKGIKI